MCIRDRQTAANPVYFSERDRAQIQSASSIAGHMRSIAPHATTDLVVNAARTSDAVKRQIVNEAHRAWTRLTDRSVVLPSNVQIRFKAGRAYCAPGGEITTDPNLRSLRRRTLEHELGHALEDAALT